MSTLYLLLVSMLLLQAPSGKTLVVELADQPEAPVELVSPCAKGADGSASKRTSLIATVGEKFFVGISSRTTRKVASFRLGSVHVLGDGSSTTRWPRESVNKFDDCGVPQGLVIAPKETSGGLRGAWVYVAEVHFGDGTSWRIPDERAFQGSLRSLRRR